MFGKRRRRRKKKITLIQRFFRSVVAVVILSAFILGISLMVKEMAGLDPYGVVKLASPILEKVGISTEKAGEVAGAFADRLLKTNIAPSESYKEDLGGRVGIDSSGDVGKVDDSGGNATSRTVVFKAAVMGDSGNDNQALYQALILAESLNVNRVFYLGDYTEIGKLDNLEAAKIVMDESGLLYYSLPGDRDLDINSNPADFGNYNSVFGYPRTSVTINDVNLGGVKFVMINNAANYTLIDSDTLGQIYAELEGADFVVSSQPFYHPLASYGKPVMGVVNGETVPELRDQAKEILGQIRGSDVKAIISGDQHAFDKKPDEEKQELQHVYIGPVSEARAERGVNSITLLSIYDDGSYSAEQVYLE